MVPEHRHKQQQGSMQCILVLAGRRAIATEIRDLRQALEIFSWEINVDCERHRISRTSAGNHCQVSSVVR